MIGIIEITKITIVTQKRTLETHILKNLKMQTSALTCPSTVIKLASWLRPKNFVANKIQVLMSKKCLQRKEKPKLERCKKMLEGWKAIETGGWGRSSLLIIKRRKRRMTRKAKERMLSLYKTSTSRSI